nr:MAG TPA: hypothetical protein [Caudoviricetes sp.]
MEYYYSFRINSNSICNNKLNFISLNRLVNIF